MPAPTSFVKEKAHQNKRLGQCLERQRQTLDDEAKLLVRAVAADLLRHHLTQHRDHRQAAVLQLLKLLLGEDLQRVRARARVRARVRTRVKVQRGCDGGASLGPVLCGSLRSLSWRPNSHRHRVPGALPPPPATAAERGCHDVRPGMRWAKGWSIYRGATGAHRGVLRLEAEEGGDLSRGLGVVLLVDGQLVDTDDSNDLRPARARHSADGLDAAGDVVEVQVERRRKQLMRRRDQLRREAANGA
jgi:hypothetical protein